MAQRLRGKVALITGAASGIGESTAKLFHRHGAKVMILDIQDELAEKVAREISSSGDDASYVHCDVTNEDDVRSAVDRAVAKYGKIDVMFGNAGILEKSTRIADFPISDFQKVINVNLTGCFLAAKHAARVMIPQRKGSIIFTASVASVMGGAANYAYTASKHAVVGLTRNLAAELGQFGIRANCISPSLVPTPLSSGLLGLSDADLEEVGHQNSPLKGVTLKAEDIAEAALHLASDESKFTSGLNLVVDGGFTVTDREINVFKGLY
ncbi:secoisolariciresinol dehydrogenase-like isoform X2 [Nymphaea colorata]|nr:secoisolariciresinol dehydrogenase-like isoform X1 [Nymphaea colorata]XP_049931559.1 secoisolariciresinol dehydrogenase-like isoform X2 [Nymphaea colorata]